MLILARKVNEKIHIGHAITITILEIKGRTVKIGIEAPQDIPIRRHELLDVSDGTPFVPAGGPTDDDDFPGEYLPMVQDVAALVREVTAERDGRVQECVESGHSLFFRATVPASGKVEKRDVYHNGFAVRVTGSAIHLRRYLFRQVCSNGLLLAQHVERESLERVTLAARTNDVSAILDTLREAVQARLAGEAFPLEIANLRKLRDMPAKLDFLDTLPVGEVAVRRAILRRFTEEQDLSAYGLLNALTSVARDERDAQRKWWLEELGGRIASASSFVPRLARSISQLAETL